jgi:uroporphyrinogen-III synthase
MNSGRPRRIWITRSQPQAEATADRVRAMGWEAVVAPVLEARAIAGPVADLAGADALAFTSAHAVDAFAAVEAGRRLPVFAVGDATTARASAAGFSEVRSAGGDAATLAELIAAAEPRPRLVVNPTAREPAADLAALLAARGVACRPLAVYETVEIAGIAAPENIDAVLIHSPRAGRVVARLIDGRMAAQIVVYAISEAASAPFRGRGFARVDVAASPTEAALLSLIEA